MNKEVIIAIKGIQDNGDEAIETRAKGLYSFINGSHYIKYDEVLDENTGERTNNLMKIREDSVFITKKTPEANSTHMEFEKNENTILNYNTDYGNLSMDVFTEKISIREKPGEVRVTLEYSLSSHGEPISENKIIIKIKNLLP